MITWPLSSAHKPFLTGTNRFLSLYQKSVFSHSSPDPCLVAYLRKAKNLNPCLVLTDSVEVTAGCQLTCPGMFACGSRLLQAGQGSLEQAALAGLEPKASRTWVWVLCLCLLCVVLNTRLGEVWTVSGCRYRPSIARLGAAWNKPVPSLKSNVPPRLLWQLLSAVPSHVALPDGLAGSILLALFVCWTIVNQALLLYWVC